jgi:hypothetical protein
MIRKERDRLLVTDPSSMALGWRDIENFDHVARLKSAGDSCRWGLDGPS